MAARYWVGGGSSANWNATGNTNWSATSGGAGNASVPGASDDVYFDGAGASGNTASTVSVGLTINTLTFTAGYTVNVTCNGSIQIQGTVFTDNSAHGWSGTGNIQFLGSITVTSNGKIMPLPIFLSTPTGTHTITLVGDWTLTGNFAIGSLGTKILNKTTTEVLYLGNGLNGTGGASGTLDIVLTGGTWNGSGAILGCNLTLQGNITASSTIGFGGGKTLLYSSGTITTTGSTMTLTSCTINTPGITWNTLQVASPNQTFTLSALLQATRFQNNGDGAAGVIFTGTYGFTVATFSWTVPSAATISFKESLTYTVTTSLSCFSSRVGSIIVFTSAHASTKAIITLQNGASCNCLASFTRIDASGGRPIRTFFGTITDCVNIERCDDLFTVASAA
jgi:hypothetical protein